MYNICCTLSYPLPILVKLKVTKLSVACSANLTIEVLMQHIKGEEAACRLFERAMAGWCCAWEWCHHWCGSVNNFGGVVGALQQQWLWN